jgi:hypothetical protein
VTAGTAATVEAVALNGFGQVATTSSDTLTLTSSDAAAVWSTQSLQLAKGVGTFQVTFETSGSQTLTATEGSGTTALSGTAKVYVMASTAPSPTSPTTPTTPTTTGITTTTSSNWSGYAAETSLKSPQSGSVTAVSGTWTVPTVTGSGSGTTYSSVWVGIDGYSSQSVEQLGTEEDVVNGQAEYSAWYEMYPSNPVTINMTVQPGDKISASVTYETSGSNAGQFLLSITDLTTTKTYSTYQTYAKAQRSSAEWIVEAPSSNNGVLPLANFGTVSFTSASATINGTTGPIDDSAWQAAAINMATRSVQEDTTSGLTDSNGTSSFTVTCNASSSTGKSQARLLNTLPVVAAAMSPAGGTWTAAVPNPVEQARDSLFASLDFPLW